MPLQIITGGARGADAAVMYWADLFHVPFRCILPAYHSMAHDLNDCPTAPWYIGLSCVGPAGIQLFQAQEGKLYSQFSITRPMVRPGVPLRSRFEVCPPTDVDAAAACRDVNPHFDQFSLQSKRFLQRDHTVAAACDRVIAFGYLDPDREYVKGGTGWTVRLALRLYKPVHLYDLHEHTWWWYDYNQTRFVPAPDTPKLNSSGCAMIGSRDLTPVHPAYEAIHLGATSRTHPSRRCGG